jgi:hypothetical protein
VFCKGEKIIEAPRISLRLLMAFVAIVALDVAASRM